MKPANQLVRILNKSFLAPIAFVLLTSSLSFALDGAPYPKGPELDETPGVVCTSPDEKRYPEQIDYCSRNVDSKLKNTIIAIYDQKFGYQIQKMNRGDFKIDHFIPLSIGGANAQGNLWPQHKSVYGITDPIELEVSILISAGKIKQADAIRAIKEVKTDLSKADAINKYLRSLE